MSSTPNFDLEVIGSSYEMVTNLNDIECKKNPGHENFFSVKDYKGEGLPQDYRDDPGLLEHVQNQADITVLLMVTGPSEHRPKYDPRKPEDKYPASDMDDKDKTIFGSGWLDWVSEYEDGKKWPCSECKQSRSPCKGWARVVINTAAHVVFDGIEGERTKCYFDYNQEEDHYESCPDLCKAVEVLSSSVADKSMMTFISHDKNPSELLLRYFRKHSKGVKGLMRKYRDPNAAVDSDLDLRIKSKQLQDRLSKVNSDLLLILWKLKLKTGKDRPQLLLDSLDQLSVLVGETYDLVRSNTMNRAKDYEVHHNFTKMSEDQVRRVGHMLFKDDTLPSDVETSTPDHSLAILVSHPHGCSKRITIGEVKERRLGHLGQFRYSQYTYNTPTCAGSSGAPIFITGRNLGVSVHTHSLRDSFDPDRCVQLSESVLNFDG